VAASTGTLVAAGLESAGYAGQSMVLSSFSPILVGGAVLIFLLLCAKSIFTMVVDGNFSEALKALFYPLLVSFCLFTLVESGGSEWQFGSLKGDQTQIKQFVATNVSSKVSLPFELFNRFVSGVSQLGIGLILDNPVSGTVLFSVRQQLLDSILNTDLISSGLRSLVHEGLQGKCGSWMDASRKIARGNRDPVYQGTPDYNNAVSTYERLYSDASLRLQTSGPSYNYITNLLTAINSAGPARTDAEDLVRGMCEGTNGVLTPNGGTPQALLDAPISCAQIWCWSGLGLVIEARAALDEAVDQTVGQNSTYKSLAPGSKAYILQKILEDITKKVSPDDETALGFDNDPSILPLVIAGYLLRKEVGNSPRGNLYSEFAETSGVGISAYQPQSNMSDDDRALLREHQSEYSLTVSTANQMLAFAYSLPYLQGVLLFALATLFPFFVITTAVMRQGGGLLFWAGAWVWVKSWDIGWAVIMLIDQLIWELMPHRSIYIPISKGLNSPITVMESAFDTDPTYSLATYYLLISMLLISIPTVMGQLFLRGSQSMTQILFGGLQQNASSPAARLETEKRNVTFGYWKSISDPSSLESGPTTFPRPNASNGANENPQLPLNAPRANNGANESPQLTLNAPRANTPTGERPTQVRDFFPTYDATTTGG